MLVCAQALRRLLTNMIQSALLELLFCLVPISDSRLQGTFHRAVGFPDFVTDQTDFDRLRVHV